MKDKWKSKWNHKLVMYGDDTWLKLFPGTFHRSEGTTSFFVSVSQYFIGANTIIAKYILPGLYRSGQQCDQACPRRIE
jgi:hypothetical protein